jgi:hypothetical protein
LRLTEVTSFGSVLAFAACAVSVWLHILTLGVCVCVCVPIAPVKAVLRGGMLCNLCKVKIPATCFGPICMAIFRLIFEQVEFMPSIYEIKYKVVYDYIIYIFYIIF